MNLDRYRRKILTFVEFGKQIAELSTCKRLKVGAIVFACDCSTVYAIGYNGPSRGLPNDSCTAEQGECGCAHAEANAIAKFNDATAKPSLFYSTHRPCLYCASTLLNCQSIIGVLYSEPYRSDAGTALITRAGISVLWDKHLHVSNRYLIDWRRRC